MARDLARFDQQSEMQRDHFIESPVASRFLP